MKPLHLSRDENSAGAEEVQGCHVLQGRKKWSCHSFNLCAWAETLINNEAYSRGSEHRCQNTWGVLSVKVMDNFLVLSGQTCSLPKWNQYQCVLGEFTYSVTEKPHNYPMMLRLWGENNNMSLPPSPLPFHYQDLHEVYFQYWQKKKTERTKSMRRLFNPSSLLTNLLTFQLYYSLLGGKNIKGWKCTGKTGNVGEMIRSWWCSLEWDGKKQLFSTKSRSDMRFCQCWPSLSSSHGQLLQKGSFSFCEQYPTAARLKTLLRPSES